MKYIILLLLSFPAYADYRHDTPRSTANLSIRDMDASAYAVAAAQHHFNWDSNRWQGSVGYGYLDDKHALSIGLGKKVDGTLINFSFGDNAAGAGVNWEF